MVNKKEPRQFVTTDSHGCYKQLKALLDEAEFDYELDTLIHLGDIVDRGEESYEVVELLLKIKNLIKIRGNHDEWFLEFIEKGSHPAHWMHGGDKTVSSYMKWAGDDRDMKNPVTGRYIGFNNTDIPETHKVFFKTQLTHYTDSQNRFFCHAGYNPEMRIKDWDDFMFYWDRGLIYHLVDQYRINPIVPDYEDVNGFKRVFIGHTPTISFKKYGGPKRLPIDRFTVEYYEPTPMYLGQLVNLDTGGCFPNDNGKLSLIDITDDDNHILYQK